MASWRWGGCPPPYINKFYTFVACIAVAFCCGLTYTFAVWSDALKRAYDLRQDQLQLIASAANVGGYSAIFSGLTFDLLVESLGHKRFGPRLVLLIGLLLNAAGYLGLWAAISGLFRAQFWQLVALAALAANGGTWGDTAALVTNVRNFPSSLGSVVGVLKAGLGLSGSLFASVYSGVFYPDAVSFLVFLALAPLVVGILALPFVNHCSFVQMSETETGQGIFTTEGRFVYALQALGTLAVYLITSAAVAALYPLSHYARLTITAGAGLLVLPLLFVPYGSGGLLSQRAPLPHALALYEDGEADGAEEEGEEEGGLLHREHAEADEEAGVPGGRGTAGSASKGGKKGGLEQPLLQEQHMERGGGSRQRQDPASHGRVPAAEPTAAAAAASAGADGVGPEKLPELTPLQCLSSPNFWLLFVVLAIGMGSALTLLNNLAQVVGSLYGLPSDVPVLVSLFSVFNCAGRIVLGYFPERLLHSRGTPRLVFLPLMSALMSATCLGLAIARLPELAPLAALAGFAFGGHWSLYPALVTELFGLKRFAANYSLVQVAPAVGSFGLAMKLAGTFYERALRRHGMPGNTCKGQDCFQPTFLTLAALGVVATACSSALCWRNSWLYRLKYRAVHDYDEAVSHHPDHHGSHHASHPPHHHGSHHPDHHPDHHTDHHASHHTDHPHGSGRGSDR